MISHKTFIVTLILTTFIHSQQTVSWKGFQWNIRDQGSQLSGPGPNLWNGGNTFIDQSDDSLHLLISQVNGSWTCAELSTVDYLPFGTYQWQIDSRTDQYDPSVVLGLFSYEGNPDGTKEIDIEFSRWGNPTYDPGSFTTYPSVSGYSPDGSTFNFNLSGTYTTARYHWMSSGISYSYMGGFQNISSNVNMIFNYSFMPTDTNRVPQLPMQLHMNLWLFQGSAPTNNLGVEVIIRNFQIVNDTTSTTSSSNTSTKSTSTSTSPTTSTSSSPTTSTTSSTKSSSPSSSSPSPSPSSVSTSNNCNIISASLLLVLFALL